MEHNERTTILSAEQLKEVTGGLVVSASLPGQDPLDSPAPYTLEPTGKLVKNPVSVPERGG
jgi:hypothetical protein